MPEWLAVILLFAALFGGAYLWETVKEKAIKKGGKLGQAAELSNRAEAAFESGLHTVLQKGGGALVGAVSLVLIYGLFNWSLGWQGLILAVLAGAYSVYLLWPGQRSFTIFF